jgi:ABC-type glycerol-3-phosphate transport system substrate-binding protein
MGSAAQIVPWVVKEIDFATLVGEVTGGILGGPRTFVALPNSGIVFQMDLFYITDQYGFPLEAGTTPHYFNRDGYDALETVLQMIAEGAY